MDEQALLSYAATLKKFDLPPQQHTELIEDNMLKF